MSDVPECVACGTCCFSRLETYVRVLGDDHERLGDRVDDVVRFESNRAYMRMHDGHCAALDVGAGSGLLFCNVYETRPQACRDLGRGSPECLGELDTKRERPLIALGNARSAAHSSIAR